MKPVKVFYPRKNPQDQPKVLTANTQDELDSLLRIGWRVGDGKS